MTLQWFAVVGAAHRGFSRFGVGSDPSGLHQDSVGHGLWGFVVDHHRQIGLGVEGTTLVQQRVQAASGSAVCSNGRTVPSAFSRCSS